MQAAIERSGSGEKERKSQKSKKGKKGQKQKAVHGEVPDVTPPPSDSGSGRSNSRTPVRALTEAGAAIASEPVARGRGIQERGGGE